MNEILVLVCTSVITFLEYEALRALFDKIKGKSTNKIRELFNGSL